MLWIVAGHLTALAQDDVTWLLSQINTLRSGQGLHTYALNAQLSAAAQQHSQYMADTCTVNHYEADGSSATDRAARNGYSGGWVSENIYGGTNARATDAWNFWINSAIHYQGLTHQVVNEIGIGVAASSCGRYYTLVFGQRGDVTAPAAPVVSDPVADNDVVVVQPTRYVPPPPTSTPTPTIPTLTPSATWTITPTHTASPSPTPVLPSATPLVLPTVPALNQEPTAVAQVPTQTATESPPTITPSPSATLAPSPTTVVAPSSSDEGIHARDLLPFAILGQVVLIGLAGFAYFRRKN